MPLDLDDTIVALASPPGPALRGIIRVSGVETAVIIAQCFRGDAGFQNWRTTKLPRRFPGHLELPSMIVPVPAALLYWPTHRSYTGQPLAEFHLSGSPPVLDAAIEHLCEIGARLARRGEFTMRAFLSGRIDLLQAEAVLGVIEATDHEELQKALSQLGGGITSQLRLVRGDLIALLGDLEAGLDFVEEDIEFITKPEIARRLDAAWNVLRQLTVDSAHQLPAGYRRRVVLAGLPNAGKSTLFNRLIGQQKALVSPVPGTTRDYLTATLQLEGLEAELIDTAGWEDAADLITERAQAQRAEQVDASDVVVWCTAVDIDVAARTEDARLIAVAVGRCPAVIRAMTRCDLVSAVPESRRELGGLQISATTGMGVGTLLEALRRALTASNPARSELLGTTAVRCRDSLNRTVQALQQASVAVSSLLGDEITAIEIRQALQELGTILGDVYTDEILDHIFSRFCIGK